MNSLRPQARRPFKSPEIFFKQCPSQTVKLSSYRSPAFPPVNASLSSIQSRTFAATTPQAATHVLQNPRKDDEGNDMLIDISERAANRLQQITANPPPSPLSSSSSSPPSSNPPPSHLRVTVTSGGCHGFQYLMSLEPSSKISSEEDTIFGPAADDTTTKDNSVADGGGIDTGARVVLDESSLELLKGSTIDYTTELIGSQFKIVGNPRAKSSCGCGTSFDIE
ncbi:MAG: hypothetical protein Q9160_000073 [Pyrenula sp. 1 TL-2023]